MKPLLHWSDPHFGTERAAVMAALRRLVAVESPEMAVLSGDITQRARPEQFRAARAFVDELALPTVAIPGNHDIPLFNLLQRLRSPYANYCREFGRELEPEYASPQFLVIAVNTSRHWLHTDGAVSRRQIERVAERLERADAGQLRIVVTHQPISVIREEDEGDRLRGGEAAARWWAAAGADLVLGGHIHLPFVHSLGERFAALPRPVWGVQAGTALSTRVRHEAGNSVNLIRTASAPRRCLVERWDFDEVSREFARVASDELLLSPD
ncbi:MAG: metallophosphoesterase family protein [Betaproteobacteria bacterium]